MLFDNNLSIMTRPKGIQHNGALQNNYSTMMLSITQLDGECSYAERRKDFVRIFVGLMVP
jgi:hypothetical protein